VSGKGKEEEGPMDNRGGKRRVMRGECEGKEARDVRENKGEVREKSVQSKFVDNVPCVVATLDDALVALHVLVREAAVASMQ